MKSFKERLFSVFVIILSEMGAISYTDLLLLSTFI